MSPLFSAFLSSPGGIAALVSATTLIVVAVIAGSIALFGHWVARSNAIIQGRISAAIAEQTNQMSRANAQLQASLTANVRLAEFRQTWINSLRDDMASFQSIAMTPDTEHLREKEFYRLGTRIELFMNRNDPDYSALEKSMYALFEAETTLERFAANPQYVAVCQRILKREWDVLKKEVRAVASPPLVSSPDAAAARGRSRLLP